MGRDVAVTDKLLADETESDEEASDGITGSPAHQEFRRLVQDRVCLEYGSQKIIILIAFMFFAAFRFQMFDQYAETAQPTPVIYFLSSLLGLLVAIPMAFAFEGKLVIGKMISLERFVHFFIIAAIAALSSLLWAQAISVEGSASHAIIISSLYLPFAALLSCHFFQRTYTPLVWFAIAMMTLSMASFMAFRVRYADCPPDVPCGSQPALDYIQTNFKFSNLMYCFAAVGTSATGAILAERVLKRWKQDRFPTLMVHVFLSSAVVFAIVWALPFDIAFVPKHEHLITSNLGHVQNSQCTGQNCEGPYFNFGRKRDFFMVITVAAESWLMLLVVKWFSVVTKAAVASVAILSSVYMMDGIEQRYSFDIRAKPAFILLLILDVSFFLFQLGIAHQRTKRRRRTWLRKDEGTEDSDANSDGADNSDKSFWEKSPWFDGIPSDEDKVDLVLAQEEAQRAEVRRCLHSSTADKDSGGMFQITVIYVVTYVAVKMFNSIAVSQYPINPSSLTLLTFVGGFTYAAFMTYQAHGWNGEKDAVPPKEGVPNKGIKQALSPRMLCKFSKSSCLLALSQVFQNLAYAQPNGNPALISVVGCIYTPLLTVLNTCRGIHSLWIEWLSVMTLFLSAFAFGWLQIYNPEIGLQLNSYMAIVFTVLSAGSAALRDLLANALWNSSGDEAHPDNTDFFMNKMRFDSGGFFFTALILPCISLTATRPIDVVWLDRPNTAILPENSTCYWPEFLDCWKQKEFLNWPWDMGNATVCANAPDGPCSNPACECGQGLFFAWGGAYPVYIFLFLNIFFGWVVGQMLSRGTAMYKARIDGVALAAVFWVGIPVQTWSQSPPGTSFHSVWGVCMKDLVLDMVNLLVPCAALSSEYAKQETKEVVEEELGYRLGIAAGLWSRMTGESTKIVISNPTAWVKGQSEVATVNQLSPIQDRQKILVNWLYGADLYKGGPYISAVQSPTQIGINFEEFAKRTQILMANRMSLQEPSKTELYQEVLASGEGLDKDEVESRPTSVSIVNRTKGDMEHMMAEIKAGVEAHAGTVEVHALATTARDAIVQQLANTTDLLGYLDAVEKSTLQEVEAKLKGKNIDDALVPPYMEFVLPS